MPSQAKLFIKTFEENRIKGNQPILDGSTTINMVDHPSPTNRYQPSKARLEVRKLDTQARHKDLQTAYIKLKRKHPEKSDRWCAIQISKMPNGKTYKAETIRKNMKK